MEKNQIKIKIEYWLSDLKIAHDITASNYQIFSLHPNVVLEYLLFFFFDKPIGGYGSRNEL